MGGDALPRVRRNSKIKMRQSHATKISRQTISFMKSSACVSQGASHTAQSSARKKLTYRLALAIFSKLIVPRPGAYRNMLAATSPFLPARPDPPNGSKAESTGYLSGRKLKEPVVSTGYFRFLPPSTGYFKNYFIYAAVAKKSHFAFHRKSKPMIQVYSRCFTSAHICSLVLKKFFPRMTTKSRFAKDRQSKLLTPHGLDRFCPVLLGFARFFVMGWSK
jgi:hypothetical protein